MLILITILSLSYHYQYIWQNLYSICKDMRVDLINGRYFKSCETCLTNRNAQKSGTSNSFFLNIYR